MTAKRLGSRSRRLLLKRTLGVTTGGAAALAATLASRPAVAAASDDDRKFMARAEEMKRQALEAGDQGYGAVVVRNGEIVGLGPSRVNTNLDPTAHAEVEAIRDACRRLGTRDLSGCVMYGTTKSCRMCETAAYWANISRLVYGGVATDGGAPTYSSC